MKQAYQTILFALAAATQACGSSSDGSTLRPLSPSAGMNAGAAGGSGGSMGGSFGGAVGGSSQGGKGGTVGSSGAGMGGRDSMGGRTSSGGAGMGGSAGRLPVTPDGGAPPVKPQDCNGLSDTAGWEEVSPPGSLGDSQAVQVDPINAGRVYVMMHKGGNGAHEATDGLYVSNDCGSSWDKVKQGRNATDDDVNVFAGSFCSLIIDPFESDIMYAVSNYGPGGVWKSGNAGVDWDQVVPDDLGEYVQGGGGVTPLWFNALSMDPTNHKHLVAANHTGCSGKYAPNCLAETRDAGDNWDLVKAPTDWAEGNGVYIIDDLTMLFATNQDGLFVTKDGGTSWKMVAGGASGVGSGGPPVMGSDGTYYVASTDGVLASSDLEDWSVVQGGQFLNINRSEKKIITTEWFDFKFWVADEDTPTNKWSQFGTGGGNAGVGGVYMAYDKEHHLLYASTFSGGLWRIVIE